jgi:predicted amidohydrolase YtcJ
VRRARIGPAQTDLRVEGSRIVAVGPAAHREPGDAVLDAAGGALLPGLHDHHLHVLASVAAAGSVRVGPPAVRDAAGLSAALTAAAAAQPHPDWIRAIGYHQSVAGDLDRDVLDRMIADRPVRVQHRSGALWVCNSAGLAALDVEHEAAPGLERDAAGRLTGRLWRMDRWLGQRLHPAGRRHPGELPELSDLARLSQAAAALGVTGWTEATPERPDPDTGMLLEAIATGAVAQRLHLMLPAGDAAAPSAAAIASAAAAIAGLGAQRVTSGPVKILLDDPALPALEALAETMARAHGHDTPVAVHCVTRVQLLLALAALEVAGPIRGDRIEHGAVIPAETLPGLARLGLTVVTQPNFVAERGDEYRSEVAADDLPDLWRARSLMAAGIRVAAGTDAPFGWPDPWLAIRAAVRRRTPAGHILGPDEAVATAVALRWWWGTGPDPAARRRLRPGQPADLVVLACPLPEAVSGDGPVPVRATIVGGSLVFEGKE